MSYGPTQIISSYVSSGAQQLGYSVSEQDASDAINSAVDSASKAATAGVKFGQVLWNDTLHSIEGYSPGARRFIENLGKFLSGQLDRTPIEERKIEVMESVQPKINPVAEQTQAQETPVNQIKEDLSEKDSGIDGMDSYQDDISDTASVISNDSVNDSKPSEMAEDSSTTDKKPTTLKASQETKSSEKTQSPSSKIGFGTHEPKMILGQDMTRAEYTQKWQENPRRMMDPRATGKNNRNKLPRATPQLKVIVRKRREAAHNAKHGVSLEGLTAGEKQLKMQQYGRNIANPWADKTRNAAGNPTWSNKPVGHQEISKKAQEKRQIGFGSYAPKSVRGDGLSSAAFQKKFQENIRAFDLSKVKTTEVK